MKKLDYIDALRGVAILAVLIVHTNQYGSTTLPLTIKNIIGQGSRGVQLFYLASAFTLFLSFKNRYTREKLPLRNFFIRRLFRIAPMYYLGICYYLFQDGFGPRYFLGDATQISTLNILSNFTFLHGFNPYWINSLVPGGWSIGVEMTFYAIMPLLFFKIKNINHAFNFFIISTSISLFLNLLLMKFPLIGFDRLWGEFLFLYFPSQLPVFSLGILLYFVIAENESLKNISGKSILVFSGMVMIQISIGFQFISHHVLFGFAFFLLAYGLSVFRFKLIVNPVINHIGKISYSMYLVHIAVLYWLNEFNFVDYWNNGMLNFSTRFLVVLVLTSLISTITYNIIEVPFQNVGKKIINRWEKRTTA
ncbi:MAG: acyltransferase family protein [Lutibacter sp.]